MSVCFDKVYVREHEVIIVTDFSGKTMLELNPTFSCEYTIPFHKFEFERHDKRTRVERNHESDTRDRRQRSSSLDLYLTDRFAQKKARLLLPCKIIQNWHIRPDGCVYQENGERSSVVVRLKGNMFWTFSGNNYQVGEPDPRIKAIYEELSNTPLLASEPFKDTNMLLRAWNLLNYVLESCTKNK